MHFEMKFAKYCPFHRGLNALSLELISWKWMFLVLPCLIRWFISFLSQRCQQCVKCVSASWDIYEYMIQIKPDPCRWAILCQIWRESSRYCQPVPVPFWYIMAYLLECRSLVIIILCIWKLWLSNKTCFIQLHVKSCNRYHSAHHVNCMA